MEIVLILCSALVAQTECVSVVCLANSEYRASPEARMPLSAPAPVTNSSMTKREFVGKVADHVGKIPILGAPVTLYRRIERIGESENTKMNLDLDPFKKRYEIGFTITFPLKKNGGGEK